MYKVDSSDPLRRSCFGVKGIAKGSRYLHGAKLTSDVPQADGALGRGGCQAVGVQQLQARHQGAAGLELGGRGTRLGAQVPTAIVGK
jgi:hypothetical protein